jgi:hypothetical protein
MNGPVLEAPSFLPFGFNFSISASSADPFVYAASPTGTARSLYFWVTCAEEGLSAFEGSVIGELIPLEFTPEPQIFNLGDANDLLLAIGGCPTGGAVNLLLGNWIVFDGGGTFCLGQSAKGNLGAVDCDTEAPSLVQRPRIIGFSSSATFPCLIDDHPCLGSPPAPDIALAPAAVTVGPTKLMWIRPNPFSATTEVRFMLEHEAHARLVVYDVAGRLVRRVLDARRATGPHGVRWDGMDMAGRVVPPGAYFLHFEADGVTETRKLVLIR